MPEDESLIARASGKIKATATATLTAENAKKALATKLVAAGLGLVFFSAGLDYFAHDDEVHHALAAAARDAEQTQVAETIEVVDSRLSDWKARAIAAMPKGLRDRLEGAAFAAGVLCLGAGVRMKLKVSPGRLGYVMRDMGGAIAGPGIVAIGAFCYLSWRGARVARIAMGSFFGHLSRGELSSSDVAEDVLRYSPWAWGKVGTVLLIGAVFAVLAVALAVYARRLAAREEPKEEDGKKTGKKRPKGPSRKHLHLEVARRTASTAALLSLGYYAAATFVAVTSAGVALRVLSWPWELDAPAFLGTLTFMSFGLGLSRTGVLLHRREEALAQETPS